MKTQSVLDWLILFFIILLCISDGNPVTGTGYDKNANVNKTQSVSKVPPGGFSHGLW